MSPSNPELIRQEVDEIVSDVRAIVDVAIGVGEGTHTKMELALLIGGKVPMLLMNGTEFAKATKMEKIDYGLEAYDALTGTDEQSLIKELPYLSAENSEKIFDLVKDGLREYFIRKFPEVSPPPV